MTKIALLATGDEIINGDILNTNGQRIAQQLIDHNLTVGNHLVAADGQAELVAAFEFLLRHHDVIISTGGLGPTSDDRTRYALSEVIDQPLEFHPDSWENISQRFRKHNLTLDASNRQQALFPRGAYVLPNPHGSAPGCKATYGNKVIYLLPGPPAECMPMFAQHVLPELQRCLASDPVIMKKWRLFSVSEGEIAAKLDRALADYDCSTGYRLDYPYLEFKVRALQDSELDNLFSHIDTLVSPHLLSDPYQPASDMLIQFLQTHSLPVCIEDHATGGKLQAKILTPQTKNILSFDRIEHADSKAIKIKITGLEALWQQQEEPGQTELTIEFIAPTQQKVFQEKLPYRKERISAYAVEHIAHQILKFLQGVAG